MTSTLAGAAGMAGYQDGMGVDARFQSPYGITIDSVGQFAYVSETDGNRIRMIDLATNVVSSISGSSLGLAGSQDGEGYTARFSGPKGVTLMNDQVLLVSDSNNNRIRAVATKDNIKIDLCVSSTTTQNATATANELNLDARVSVTSLLSMILLLAWTC